MGSSEYREEAAQALHCLVAGVLAVGMVVRPDEETLWRFQNLLARR